MFLGRFGAILEASWAVLERRDDEKARKPNTFKNPQEINDFDLLGPSWECSWSSLGTSWRPVGPSGSHLGRLGAIVQRFEALLDCLGGLLGPLGPSLGNLGPEKVMRETAGSPGRFRNSGSGPLNDYSGLRPEA